MPSLLDLILGDNSQNLNNNQNSKDLYNNLIFPKIMQTLNPFFFQNSNLNNNSLNQIQPPLQQQNTPFDEKKYAFYVGENDDKLKPNYKPLNYDELFNNGAFRVTHIGLGKNEYNPNPKAGFSLVSAANDALGETTKTWKNNPEAYDVVKKVFAKNPEYIGPHKYMQIVESARDLGIPEDKIFLNLEK
jgi:hypothetical protein